MYILKIFPTKPFSVKTLIMNSDDTTCCISSKQLDTCIKIYEVSPLHSASAQQLLLQAPLRLSETLQELSLELSYCDPKVMAHFGCGLEVSNIRTLTLFMGCYRDFGEATVRLAEARSYEKITQEMMVLLLPYIAKLKFLEHLQLGTINIINDRDEQYSVSNDADDAFKPLYTMLKSTRTLKTLGLHSTNIVSLGIHHLCSGLQENSTLTGLSVTSFHSCNLFTLLDFVRIENLYLEGFRLNELGKLCSIIFSKYNTIFQEVTITVHVCKFISAVVDLIKLQVIRKSTSVNLQMVYLEWDHLLSVNDVIGILHNLKDNCQYLRNISIKGSLASDTETAKDAGLVEHCAQNSKCKIGELFAHFLLNSECTFDFSKTAYKYPTKLHLDPQMSFIVPFLCSYEDSFLIHNNITYTKYTRCTNVVAIYFFELHLQPVSELPSHLQQFPTSLSSLQQIVSTQKCVERITTHAKKCTPTIVGLSLDNRDKDHECWIYIVVNITIMGSDHVTDQNQLTWIVDAIEIKCPYAKHLALSDVKDNIIMKEIFPDYLKGSEEGLEKVNSDFPFLKPRHQDTSSPPR